MVDGPFIKRSTALARPRPAGPERRTAPRRPAAGELRRSTALAAPPPVHPRRSTGLERAFASLGGTVNRSYSPDPAEKSPVDRDTVPVSRRRRPVDRLVTTTLGQTSALHRPGKGDGGGALRGGMSRKVYSPGLPAAGASGAGSPVSAAGAALRGPRLAKSEGAISPASPSFQRRNVTARRHWS